jgi:hypothetical protein
VDGEGLRLIMPGMYEQLVVTQVQLAAHVGLAVALALTTHDELVHGASISRFGREARELLTEIGVALKKRHGSKLAVAVAEVEAQRLALRHGHEFMSWLAFRRGDERYPATERLERLLAFKVDTRVLQSREALSSLLGSGMAAALEGADRFLLGNRWRLSASADHAIEAYVWPILSYQSRAAVLAEQARWEYDMLVEGGAAPVRIEQARLGVAELLSDQFADALDHLPPAARMGG